METEQTLFFSLLQYGMGWQTTLPEATAESLEAVWQLALRQDVGHLLADGIEKTALLSEDSLLSAQVLRCSMLAVYRYEQQNYALGEVAQAFAAAQIPYLPLKGAVLRQWYPQPWMRTGCDLDILVPSEQMEKAAAVLTEQLGYRRGKQGAHDISFFTPTDVHIELHHCLVEDGRAGEAARVLSAVWEHAHPAAPDGYGCAMEDSLFYFYHIAHMAKHMESGGCGVRFFLDLWVLEKQPHNREERDTLLRQGGLLTFAEGCRRLAAYWFGDGAADETVLLLQAFVLGGGVYGSTAIKAATARNRQGSKTAYLFNRLFPPHSILQWDYPPLRAHPWLLPFFWLWRFIRLPWKRRLHRSFRALHMAEQQSAATAELFKRLDL